jgi:hypothetical protein
MRRRVAAAQLRLDPLERVAQSLRLGDSPGIVLRQRCAVRFGLAAHLARLACPDTLGAIVCLPQAVGDGLELIKRLPFDLGRPRDGDEGELRSGEEPGFHFCCVIHEKVLIPRRRVATACRLFEFTLNTTPPSAR